jgi:hypothetical protein
MTSMMLRDLTLESLRPSANAPLAFETLISHFFHFFYHRNFYLKNTSDWVYAW